MWSILITPDEKTVITGDLVAILSNCCNLKVVINVNVILRCLQLSYGTKNQVISDGVEGAGNANTTVVCCLYSQLRSAKFLVEVSENTV